MEDVSRRYKAFDDKIMFKQFRNIFCIFFYHADSLNVFRMSKDNGIEFFYNVINRKSIFICRFNIDTLVIIKKK